MGRQPNSRRWYAIGDPQATHAKVLAVLRHHGLLATDDRLLPEVGLVSMGDHFDYGATADVDHAERRRAGLEGCAILEWLAGHPADQVRILAGNHDLARVQELATVDDLEFETAREAAAKIRRLPRDERVAPTAAFHDRFPSIPTPDLACRDFSTFVSTQRDLVKRLLVDGRLECAVAGAVAGRPCLVTHAGVTSRELDLIGIESRDPVAIAGELDRWFCERVARAAGAWARGHDEALDLAPVHVAGESAQEAGGWFASRPANPDRPSIGDSAWEWSPERPRRFHPRTLPEGLLQVVGHTRHRKLAKELVPWVREDRGTDVGGFHRLHVEHGDVTYGRDVDGDGALMIFTDVGIHERDVVDVPLLELELMLEAR